MNGESITGIKTRMTARRANIRQAEERVNAHPALTLHADWSSMNAKPIVPDASAFLLPEYPIRHDVELEQRTLDALEAAYESAILAELDRDGREDAL